MTESEAGRDPHAVHIFLLETCALAGCDALNACRALVSPAEWDAARGGVAEPRRAHLLGRALARTALSRFEAVAPARWELATNPHGRPEIVAPRSRLRFNVSHADGLVACVVARGREVGVDVEGVTRRPRALAVARRFFAPSEYEWLSGLAAAERDREFWRLWTLKEAYVKARGVGIAFGLARFAFELGSRGDGALRFHPPPDDRADDWHFVQLCPTPAHLLAAAVHRPGGGEIEIRTVAMTLRDGALALA